MSDRRLPWFRVVSFALVAALVGGVVALLRSGGGLPDTVQPIAWSRQPCAHCQMLIGEPRSAAQLITTAGEVRSFDDPGCALRYLAEARPALHRMWFHHAHTDRWLPIAEVGFLTGGTTPMGSGLLAVEASTPGALSVEAARARALAPAPHALATPEHTP